MADGQHTTTAPRVDWDRLRAAALAATEHAYVPYSGFRVGAAALTDDGRLVSGCNIENASYGLTLCAECALLADLRMGGGGRLAAFVCVDGAGVLTMPCGRCRQLLYEFRPRARAAHPGGGAGDRRGAAGRLRPGRPGAGGPSLTCGALPGPLARVGG